MKPLRFRFAPKKAYAALHWMLGQRQSIDLHAVLKACYFSDKTHLNAFYRPIFGATYKAMRFGPVPLEIYEMAKGEPLWLADIGIERFPWTMDGYRLRLTDNIPADLSELSETDREHLATGLQRSLAMTFTERTAATHGSDWQAADLGLMRYEDMLDDSPDKGAVIDHLRENARFMRL
jgi:hypothetical protein